MSIAAQQVVPPLTAMKQARQIIWRYRHETPLGNQPHMIAHEADQTIERIDQAIAELESQEPVAWCIWLCGGIVGFFDKQDEAIEEFRRRNQEYPDESRKLVPLYTHPPQRTEKEPVERDWREAPWGFGEKRLSTVEYSDIVSDGGLDPRNKFDIPPQRTWVGLTLEQYVAINSSCVTVEEAISSTEKQIKENNT